MNKQLIRAIVAQADAARDRRDFSTAAYLFDHLLEVNPNKAGYAMQSGHMHKEFKNFEQAEERYLRALKLNPKDAEIHLQLGHFYKTVGRFKAALSWYRSALEIRGDWEDARREISDLQRNDEYLRESPELDHVLQSSDASSAVASDLSENRYLRDGRLDEDLVARPLEDLYVEHRNAFVFKRNGIERISPWGRGPTVDGIDCLRGYLVSDQPCLDIKIYLDGELVYQGALVPGPQRNERTNRQLRKYAYNAWIDFSRYERGWHDLIFVATKINGESVEGESWMRSRIIVGDPIGDDRFYACDGVIDPASLNGERPLVDAINALPSMVHQASTKSFPGKVDTIAVLRPDQLGDMTVTIPALREVRRLFPSATIVGLVSKANEVLAASSGLFDELILIDFPDDVVLRQRLMTEQTQAALLAQLQKYRFDLTLDFAIAGVAFKLLPLIGAPINLGYGDDQHKTLGAVIESHDPKAKNDIMRSSARTRGIVEALKLWFDSGAEILPSRTATWERLAIFGIQPHERYAVLHSGARVKFTCWHGYESLARRLAREQGIKVILIEDSTHEGAGLIKTQTEDPRVLKVTGRVGFEEFDALLSLASLFVGNDSGPKHLAALRGTPVISIHSARTDWREWGQENTGVIISRKVPCAGCSLNSNYEECAQQVACIKYISVDEVYGEARRLLSTQ